MDHLSRRVQKLGRQYNLKLPTATDNRHAGATETARTCSERERSQVATQMSHCKTTQDCYYVRLKGLKEARKGFQILAKVRQGATPGSTPRRPFTEDEIESIKLYFESYIDGFDQVSLPQCREFLQNHPLN